MANSKPVKVDVVQSAVGDTWDTLSSRSDIVVMGTPSSIVVDFSRAFSSSNEKTMSFVSEVLAGAMPRNIRVTLQGNRMTLENIEGFGTVAVAEAICRSAEKAVLDFQQDIVMPEALLSSK